jgi:hypothetical protein
LQSRKADYEEVKLSKLEALKPLEEDAKARRVVMDEALVILGDLPAPGPLPETGDQRQRKVVDRLLNDPFDEILEFKRGVRTVVG